MNRTITAGCMLAFTLTATSLAQSLTASPGKTVQQLFQTAPGYTVGGLDFDASKNAYYLLQSETDSTKLVRRNAADNYATPTTLFDMGATLYGSFVRISGQTVYFGESSAWSIRTFDVVTSTTSFLATVVGNYDLAVGGGFGWVSANAGAAAFSPQNEVRRLNLATGATTTILTSSDFSGPVAMDEAGALFYGANQYGAGGDIFKYSAAEIAAGGLTLDAGHKFRENVNNASLAYSELGPYLFTTDYSGIFRENAGAVTGVETWATSPHAIGFLSDVDEFVFAGVTNYSTNRSAVYSVVPEPAAAGLLAMAFGLLSFRRRSK